MYIVAIYCFDLYEIKKRKTSKVYSILYLQVVSLSILFISDKYVCYVNPCYNRGVCVENSLAPCHCARGYVGTFCHGKSAVKVFLHKSILTVR